LDIVFAFLLNKQRLKFALQGFSGHRFVAKCHHYSSFSIMKRPIKKSPIPPIYPFKCIIYEVVSSAFRFFPSIYVIITTNIPITMNSIGTIILLYFRTIPYKLMYNFIQHGFGNLEFKISNLKFLIPLRRNLNLVFFFSRVDQLLVA
jgi:hypothetical protein